MQAGVPTVWLLDTSTLTVEYGSLGEGPMQLVLQSQKLYSPGSALEGYANKERKRK